MPTNSLPHRPRKYRADIDGLRAIAVLFVLGFHAFPKLFPGGFCGVDVFFVISGFLISGILFEEMEEDSFRYSVFYKRRIKRIVPALVVVLLACAVLGWFLLFDGEYFSLGREIANGGTFLTNFLLWQQSGYFDRASFTKPLMHLWSLGIEEQFYLVWPPLLMLASRFGKSFLKVTLGIAVVSFAFNLGYLHLHSPGAYFSPLSRFWELMIGGVLAYQNRHRAETKSNRWQSLVGISLIILSFFVVNEHRAFPGWWALAPTLGAYLIISAGEQDWVNRRILSHPLLVWFGLISFPLYLWHWPLLSFAHILEGAEPPWMVRAFVVLLSILLAWLTYRLVEQPIRRSTRDRVWLPSVSGALFAVVLAGFYLLHVGVRSRAIERPIAELAKSGEADGSQGFLELGCGASNPKVERLFGLCAKDKRGPASIALVGDSKAHALVGGLVRESDSRSRLLVIVGRGPDGEAPVPVISQASIYRPYQKSIQTATDLIASNPNLKAVVITSAVRVLFQLKGESNIDDLPDSPYFETAREGMEGVVSKLVRAGKKVIFTVDNPTLTDSMNCLPRHTGSALLDRVFHTQDRWGCAISYDRQIELSQKYREVLQKLALTYPKDVLVFDPTSLLCDLSNRTCSFQLDQHRLYGLTDHVSDYASGLIGKSLIPAVKEFAGL